MTPRALVRAQTQKRRVPETTLGRPLHEPYLRHQLRPDPLNLPHLVGRHAAAPAGRLRVRQVVEGAVIDMVRRQRLEYLATQMRHEAGSHLAREPQPGVVVVADQQRVDAVRPGAVAADHELLLVLKLQLLPGVAPLPGLVRRVLALRDHALEPEAAHRLDDRCDGAGQFL